MAPAIDRTQQAAARKAAKASLSQNNQFNIDKSTDFASWFEAVLDAADILDKRYPIKGMPVMKPYGFFMHNAIMDLVEKEWTKLSIDKVQFPALIPRNFLAKEEDHIKGFDKECYWVTKGGLDTLDMPLALRPTSETAMYHMFSLWIRSFRDLPLKVHQSCAVYRYETKSTRPLIRVREIHWNEAHTCHETEAEALKMLEEAWRGYLRVCYDQLGFIGVPLRRAPWDQFPGAHHSQVLDTIMPCGRVLQTIGAHYLAQHFAEVFEIKFMNRENTESIPYMTCFGVSTRLLAAAIATHGDANGLILPPAIAKIQVVIIPLINKKLIAEGRDGELRQKAEEMRDTLVEAGIRAIIDDSDKSPGAKFNHYEMLGVPLRVELGMREVEENKICFKRRADDLSGDAAKEFASLENTNIVAFMNEQLEICRQKIVENGRKWHDGHVTHCETLEEVKETMTGKGGFAVIPICKDCGEQLDGALRSSTGGEIRGFKINVANYSEGVEEVPAGTKCFCGQMNGHDGVEDCGHEADVYAYVARCY